MLVVFDELSIQILKIFFFAVVFNGEQFSVVNYIEHVLVNVFLEFIVVFFGQFFFETVDQKIKIFEEILSHKSFVFVIEMFFQKIPQTRKTDVIVYVVLDFVLHFFLQHFFFGFAALLKSQNHFSFQVDFSNENIIHEMFVVMIDFLQNFSFVFISPANEIENFILLFVFNPIDNLLPLSLQSDTKSLLLFERII